MTSSPALIPVLEIGGTHLATALVDRTNWSVVRGSLTRTHVDPKADTDDLLDALAKAANALVGQHGSEWAIAIPGPFDYERGIGRYENVDKFEGLTNQDVRGGLLSRITPTPVSLHFINDADAYGLGESVVGASRGYARSVCLTLGTGVGSAYVVDGVPVQSGRGVAPQASAHLLQVDGKPLEETMSRRALRARYGEAIGVDATEHDVREIFERARGGDSAASAVVEAGLSGLGRAMAASLAEFDAEVLVLGGSMTGSWDLVEPAVRRGLVQADASLSALPIKRAEHPDDAPIVGAAFWAVR